MPTSDQALARLRATAGARRGARWGLGVGLLLLVSGVVLLSIQARLAGAQPRAGQPWLGVVLADDAGPGVRIREVLPASPAAKAGLRPGDRLLRVDGGAVPDARAVQQAVAAQRVGKAVEVEIRRGARKMRLRVQLEAMPTYAERVRRALLGRKAPAFRVLRADGAPGQVLDSAQLRGKVVLLEFWTSWCGACRSVVPFMKALHAQYARFGLEVVAIAHDPVARIGRLAQQLALPYRVGADPKGAAFAAYGIRPVPAFVLIDRKGVVRGVAVGAGWGGALRGMLQKLHGMLQAGVRTRPPGHRARPAAHP